MWNKESGEIYSEITLSKEVMKEIKIWSEEVRKNCREKIRNASQPILKTP